MKSSHVLLTSIHGSAKNGNNKSAADTLKRALVEPARCSTYAEQEP